MRVLEEIPSQTPEESGVEINSSEYQPLAIAIQRKDGVVSSLLLGKVAAPQGSAHKPHLALCFLFKIRP